VGNLLVRFWEGQESNWGMEKILWHRRESRRETEKTNIFLQPREAPAYSNMENLILPPDCGPCGPVAVPR